MLKLLLKAGSVILLLYSCQGIEVEKKKYINTSQRTNDNMIAFPSCFLKIDTLLPDDNILEEHFKILEGYIIDSIPREAKNKIREKKYYFYFNVHIDKSFVDEYEIDPYMDYMNELAKLLHLPMGTVDGYPIADTYFTYTPLYTVKGDSSFIKITLKQTLD
jgi:hypothetical protein